MNAKQLIAQVKKDVKRTGENLKKRLVQPTETWDNKPDFTVSEPSMVGDDLVCRVRTVGKNEGDDEYFFLDEGTKNRYATMTSPFKPKTTPRSFRAAAGVGGFAYVNRKIDRGPIIAREWTKLAALEYGAILQSTIDRTLAGYKGKPLSTAKSPGRKYTP